jgi:hypothetical protein
VCDGCGTDYEEEDRHIHFGFDGGGPVLVGWTWEGDVHRCRYCPPPPDPDRAYLPGPDDQPIPGLDLH